MSWRAKAGSSEGVNHRKHGIPCQDYVCYDFIREIVIGAVADGAGSASRAEKGSQITVEVATKYLKDWVQSQDKRLATIGVWAREDVEQVFSRVFSVVLEKVVAALQAEVAQSGYRLKDYACTLLLFIAAPNWIATMQLGDGFIVVKLRHDDYRLLFQPDKGEFANETTFVTSSNARCEMKIRFDDGVQEFICASTDGLERVALNLSNWQPSPKFFDPLRQYIGEQKHVDKEPDYLKKFLDSARLNERTDDDKALLLCFYDPNIPSRPGNPQNPRSESVPTNNDQTNVLQTLVPTSRPRVPTHLLLVQSFVLNLMAGALVGWLTPMSLPLKVGAFLVFIWVVLLTWVWSFGNNLLKSLTTSLYVIFLGISILDIISYGAIIIISKNPFGQIIKQPVTTPYLLIPLAVMMSIMMSLLMFTTILVLPITPRRTFTQNFRLTISISSTGFFVGLLLLFLIERLELLA